MAREAQLLAAAIRVDAPASELAAGLEAFARTPVVTRSAAARLAELRSTAHRASSETASPELKRAAQAVTEACRTIDTPEQRAEDAIDEAIGLLGARKYRGMLERFTVPGELDELRRSGRVERVVARFDGGWGHVLLEKLKRARQSMPTINQDRTVTFVVPGTQDATTHPVTLVEIAGRWYFRE